MNKKGFVSTGIVLALLVLFVTLFITFINSFNVSNRLVMLQVNDIKENFNYSSDLISVLKKSNSFVLEDEYYVLNTEDEYYVSIDNNLNIIDKFDNDYVYFIDGEKIYGSVKVTGYGTGDDPYILMEDNHE